MDNCSSSHAPNWHPSVWECPSHMTGTCHQVECVQVPACQHAAIMMRHASMYGCWSWHVEKYCSRCVLLLVELKAELCIMSHTCPLSWVGFSTAKEVA